MNYSIVDKIELTENICTKIGEIYISCGWGNEYNWKSIKTALLNTDYYRIAVNDEGSPLGLIRAFSDSVFATWLSELIVSKNVQKNGIGTALLNQFSKDFEHTAIYALPLKGTEKFFEKIDILEKEKLLACSRRARS